VNQSVYHTIVRDTFQALRSIGRLSADDLTLAEIEETATPIARRLAPTGTYLPDIALEAGFDVIAISNNEALMRTEFTLRGTWARVIVGTETGDRREHLFFFEGAPRKNLNDLLDAEVKILAGATGEELRVIEVVEIKP